MGLTTDPNDPRLGHGIDNDEIDQHDTYLVMEEEKRLTSFIRPVRTSYMHVGTPGPTYPLEDLTNKQM